MDCHAFLLKILQNVYSKLAVCTPNPCVPIFTLPYETTYAWMFTRASLEFPWHTPGILDKPLEKKEHYRDVEYYGFGAFECRRGLCDGYFWTVRLQ